MGLSVSVIAGLRVACLWVYEFEDLRVCLGLCVSVSMSSYLCILYFSVVVSVCV